MKHEKKNVVTANFRKAIVNSNFIKDNKGSSLLLVLAVFVVLLAVVVNILMLVSAGGRTLEQEYETAQTELYIQSVYEILNEQMVSGAWEEAFVQDETITIEVEGFMDEGGDAIPVSVEITLDGKAADVEYRISYRGKQYGIDAEYDFRKNGEAATITLKACKTITRL